MTQTPTRREQWQKEQDSFFEAIDNLSKGQRVALRRSAGIPIEEASAQALSAFYSCLPYKVKYQIGRWFASACLHCMWDEDASGRQTLPDLLGKMRKTGQLNDSMKKRVLQIMDTAWRDDGYLLTKVARLVRTIRQMGYEVDCNALLSDLRIWNYDKQYAQRAWGRAIFVDTPDTEETTEEE